MNFDWQTVLVALVVVTASYYVVRRALRHVKSLTSKSGGSCATGCGMCGDAPPSPSKRPASFVQVTRNSASAVRRQVGR